ncbi:hypothetical protein [Gordonia sp. (in: high G+C Gram-positive bacteria)]|uniref:hypothetical protein n=1 Tax=Gordonia sp. (in: high G+C Gram-positive bacteria) TaxID=84139 RepID=UPI0035283239
MRAGSADNLLGLGVEGQLSGRNHPVDGLDDARVAAWAAGVGHWSSNLSMMVLARATAWSWLKVSPAKLTPVGTRWTCGMASRLYEWQNLVVDLVRRPQAVHGWEWRFFVIGPFEVVAEPHWVWWRLWSFDFNQGLRSAG